MKSTLRTLAVTAVLAAVMGAAPAQAECTGRRVRTR